MSDTLEELIAFLAKHNGINDKAALADAVASRFGLTKDRSVYCRANFGLRFSSSASRAFGNTVLSLSNLQKYDDRPFIVCVVTPSENYCLLANSTFLKKISHSSQDLRENNIRGSFNGSDIAREFRSKAFTTRLRISTACSRSILELDSKATCPGWSRRRQTSHRRVKSARWTGTP